MKINNLEFESKGNYGILNVSQNNKEYKIKLIDCEMLDIIYFLMDKSNPKPFGVDIDYKGNYIMIKLKNGEKISIIKDYKDDLIELLMSEVEIMVYHVENNY